MIFDEDRLRRTLGGPEWTWLLERARKRLERGEALEGPMSLREPSASQRSAVERLFGRVGRMGASLTVELGEVGRILAHAGICDDFVEAIELLVGPCTDQRALRAEREQAWASLFEGCEQRVSARPELVAWLKDLRDGGIVRRLSGGDHVGARLMLDRAVEVASRLPARGIPIAELAASACGDSHALDAGQPIGSLVVRLAAGLGGVEFTDDAEGRRDAWSSVGVLSDELSAPVLVLNLRADSDSLLGRALGLHAESGEPYRISVRQLLRGGTRFSVATTGARVFVCENPTVVAAAANRLGSGSAPLICLEGQPKTAARLLLHQLAGAGIEIAYHGDFDWPGVRIANLVVARHSALPWRFLAADYLAIPPGGKQLEGDRVEARWDADLAVAMAAANRAVHEEQVMDDLLADLADVGGV